MSAVVLQELVAGANDTSAIKELERLRQEYRRANKLLVPNEEDWWHVGLVLNALQRGRRSKKLAIYRGCQSESDIELLTMY
jgi:hypothetical protein